MPDMVGRFSSEHGWATTPVGGDVDLAAENAALRSENRGLQDTLTTVMDRLDALERRVVPDAVLDATYSDPTVKAAAPAAALDAEDATVADARLSRRGLLVGSAAGMLAAAAGIVIASPKAASALTSSGSGLTQFMDFDKPPVKPGPADTKVRWTYNDKAGVGAGYVSMLQEIVSDNYQQNSYAWPQYIELRGTNHASATQASAQSVGSTVRFFNRSTGTPWIVGFHAEAHHGTDVPGGAGVVQAKGNTIGYNFELNNRVMSGRPVGVNIQNTGPSAWYGAAGLMVQSTPRDGSTTGANGWGDNIRFEGAGRKDIDANIGINFTNTKCNMGVDLQNNSLRLNANQRVYLDAYNTVWIQYNSTTSRIELYRNSAKVASF